MAMTAADRFYPRLLLACFLLGGLLLASALLAVAVGSSGWHVAELWNLLRGEGAGALEEAILLKIRLPRVILAAAVGATLSLGGLVFQALLRNPLAEPYILGVSGGSAVGAIVGMFLGLAPFPGVVLSAFGGSMLVLVFVMAIAAGRLRVNRDSLLLGGVMMNAFCGAVIMFCISIAQRSEMQQIFFWLMGDFTMFTAERLPLLLLLLPCFAVILLLARPMNILLLGREAAVSMGISVERLTLTLLLVTTFMVSLVVCQAGLVGFVGLVIPHVFRLLLGPDHRLLGPASLLGGASYLILCDLLARRLPQTGEMPVGILTALIGAPLFIFLLWRVRR